MLDLPHATHDLVSLVHYSLTTHHPYVWQVIMQTNSIKGKSISVVEAIKEIGADMAKFGEPIVSLVEMSPIIGVIMQRVALQA